MPALPLWVWTMSGRSCRKMFRNLRNDRQSSQGLMGRTSSGTILNASGQPANRFSREPSGPSVNPEIKSTCRSGFSRNPRTEPTVFSCAPPIINRVMTWVTRIQARSRRAVFEFCQAGIHQFDIFGEIRRRVCLVEFVISNRRVGVFFSISNFTEVEIHGKFFRQRLAQHFVVGFCLVELLHAQVRFGAHELGKIMRL